MVRNYKRRTNKGSYDKDQLREAILAVQNGTLSGYKASQVYKIPRMTIMDHVHRKRSTNNIGRKTTLSLEVEKSLASCLHTMEKHGFGLTRAEVLEMVGEFINKNNIVTSFKNGTPGKDWFVSFAKRHSLSIKKPQGVEYARKTAIDPYVVYPYFDLLEKTINELGLREKPHAIWNLDETSFSKDPSKTKIVGVKGYAATRVIATPGKDNTTVLLGASAAGQKTPPLIIFKGKNVWDEWTSRNAYPGTTYAATKNGWMESEVFESFFKKSFLPTIGDERPVLLIYDGHSTHVGLNIIEEARRANVTIIKIPAHTSHVLQPLDVAVMKSFKNQWDQKLVQWQRLNIGTPLPKKEFARLIGSIWTEINPQVLRNGFKKAGIYPINRNEIHHCIFDPLQLKRWQHSILSQPAQPKKEPQTLLIIALKCLNEYLFTVCKDKQEITLTAIDHISLVQTLAEDKNISFEELLLQKVKRGDNSSKTKKRKVAPGAEVITHDDVIKFKKDEQSNKKNPKGKKQTNPSVKLTDNVISLSDISRNDSQLMPFAVRNSKDLPICLQKHGLDTPKVKILSNIVVKKATKPTTRRRSQLLPEPGPSEIKTSKTIKTKTSKSSVTSFKFSAKDLPNTTMTYKGKGNGKKSIGKENKGPTDLKKTGNNFDNCKPAKLKDLKIQDISRSSSTTSVSGTCSDHSDSDIVNVSFDYENNDDECLDMLHQNAINLPVKEYVATEVNQETEIDSSLRFNLRNKRKTHDCEVNLKATKNEYCINDHVLVRYFNRNKWTYYVGIIENISIQNGEFFYNVRFYKTIKKPNLIFKMTKKVIDRDDVPGISIVKKIDLSNDKQILNSFVLSCEDDELYFS